MPPTATPQIRFRTIGAVPVRPSGSGSPHKTAVMLASPWPESIHASAPIRAPLAGHARLLAMDLLGYAEAMDLPGYAKAGCAANSAPARSRLDRWGERASVAGVGERVHTGVAV